MKKIALKVLIVFICLYTFLYINQYSRHVLTAPQTHKEARKDYVNAMMIHFVYFALIKAGIDFQSPILAPLKNARDYFYKRGIEKLPKNDAERAIWFHVFELGPYNISVKGKYGYLLRDYGKAYGDRFLEDTLKHIVLLADYEVIDKKNKDMSRFVVQAFFELNSFYIHELKVIPTQSVISNENLKAFVKEENLFKKLSLLSYKRESFLNKYKINNYIKKTNNYHGSYFQFHDNNLYLSSMILFYKIETTKTYNCKKLKKYFKNIFISKQKIRKFFSKLNLTTKQLDGQEKVFARQKIANKRYDKYVTNPFKMYVNCNYDDIFIKEGN